MIFVEHDSFRQLMRTIDLILTHSSHPVNKYDTATTCGLVWIANFVAYRCRTCAISPCMSLCAECFQKGEHEGHDFNMFRSLAGGKVIASFCDY